MEVQNQIFTKRFNLLFISNLTVFLVFYALLTIFPFYVIQTLNGTQDQAGLLVTTFMISAIVVRPFSGKLLDIYGKKRLLVAGSIFYLICTLLYTTIDSLSVLFAIRFLQGASFSIVTTGCMALAADTIPAHRKGAGLGYFMMSSNLAIVLGPLVGLLLMKYVEFEMIFVAFGFIMLLGTITGISIKTDDLPKPNRQAKVTFKLHDLFEMKAMPIAIIGLAVSFTYTTILSFMSLYAEEKDLLEAASYFYIVFAAAMMLIRPIAGKLFDVKGPKFIIVPALIVYAIGLVIMAQLDSSLGLVLSAIVIGIGFGTVSAGLQTQAVQSAAASRSSYVTATYFTLYDAGIALGSYIFGLVILYFKFAVIYQVAAIIVIFILIAYIWYMRNSKVTV